ncbi:MAG: hypothetical protein HWE16_17370 [Gammaproteobacteria bacterium]|nr:hypothetical protein [Gammaproteobacteria bacterium]
MIFRVLFKICVLIACLFLSAVFAAHDEKPQIIILAKNFSGHTSNIAKSIELSELTSKYVINSESLENWTSDQNPALYVALGIDALSALQSNGVKQPVLTGLITSSQWIAFKTKNPNTNFSAIFYDPDLAKQLILTKAIAPLTKSIGIMHSEQYRIDEEVLNKVSKQIELQLDISINNSSDDFTSNYAELSHNNDATLLIPDRANFNRNTIPKAILTSYRQGKLTIGYSKGTVKSGALATSYTSTTDYTQDLINAAQSLLSGKVTKTNRFSNLFSVEINREVAKSLGIVLPSNSDIEQSIQETLAKITSGKLDE